MDSLAVSKISDFNAYSGLTKEMSCVVYMPYLSDILSIQKTIPNEVTRNESTFISARGHVKGLSEGILKHWQILKGKKIKEHHTYSVFVKNEEKIVNKSLLSTFWAVVQDLRSIRQYKGYYDENDLWAAEIALKMAQSLVDYHTYNIEFLYDKSLRNVITNMTDSDYIEIRVKEINDKFYELNHINNLPEKSDLDFLDDQLMIWCRYKDYKLFNTTT